MTAIPASFCCALIFLVNFVRGGSQKQAAPRVSNEQCVPLPASACSSQAAPFSSQATSQPSASPFAPHFQCGSTVVERCCKSGLCENACANAALCDVCLLRAILFPRGSGSFHAMLSFSHAMVQRRSCSSNVFSEHARTVVNSAWSANAATGSYMV